MNEWDRLKFRCWQGTCVLAAVGFAISLAMFGPACFRQQATIVELKDSLARSQGAIHQLKITSQRTSYDLFLKDQECTRVAAKFTAANDRIKLLERTLAAEIVPARQVASTAIPEFDDDEGVDEDEEHAGPLAFGDSGSSKRSPQWPGVRNPFAKSHPRCCVCGRKTTVIHHKKPFHLYSWLELEISNLVQFCDRCHLLIGHLGNYQNYNPDIDEHIRILSEAKIKADTGRKRAKQSKTTVAP